MRVGGGGRHGAFDLLVESERQALHLGEVQWALGDRDAARKTWKDALERDPNAKAVAERLERAGR